MPRLGDFRHIAGTSSARGVERVLEQLVGSARTDPRRVVAEASQRGLPVAGRDVYEQVFSLRRLPPQALDPLAASYVRANSLVAGAQGFVTSLGGIAALPVSLSADTIGALYWIVRATSGVMNAYGFETETEEGAAQLRVGLLVALGVNSVAVEGTRVFVQHLSQQLLSTPYSQQLLVAGGRQIAGRLVSGGVRSRAARAVPLVGGAIGGAVNLGMVRAIGGRTRQHYRDLLVQWQHHRGEVAVPAVGAIAAGPAALRPGVRGLPAPPRQPPGALPPPPGARG
jgi:hypothetical protein